MAAKKMPSTDATHMTTSKTAFILELPLDMPAAEVVAKATEAGIPLSNSYVYAIRSSQRRKARRDGWTAPKRSLTKTRSAGILKNDTVETRFVALALDVGLSRAEELIAKVRAKMPTLLL